jgi:catalase
MKQPSKSFSEIIAAGEEEKFATYTNKLKAIQKAKSKKYGKGRLLHRKGLLALKAEFQVDANLPAHAAQGIFASPGKYEAIIRLSNGSLEVQADKTPDIRGFALKVKGVSGNSILTGKPTTEQDFVMINHTTFSSARAEEFLDLLLAISSGGGALLKHLYNSYGFFGMFKAMARFAKVIGKKFTSFATENFSTVLPIRNGDYAVKLRIRPVSEVTTKPSKVDLTTDLKEHLKSGALEYAVELQFYTDAETTPIEDASVEWPESETAFVTVGKLTVPVQSFAGDAYEKFAASVEQMKFDPWNAIEAHRPLGNIMRARKHAYYASQIERGA